MFKFNAISESNRSRPKEFSAAMRNGAILHFARFIHQFHMGIASAECFPTLNFFRTSLARRGLLYSIMVSYWTGEKFNLSAECKAKNIDFSNAKKTIKMAQRSGLIDENFHPSEQLEAEFREGVSKVLDEETLLHLARSLIGSNMMARMAEHVEVSNKKSGIKP
tara:strand:- start:7376 stop:7867 length:492 start_codon:yes stop_codon:yes gene_type:complete